MWQQSNTARALCFLQLWQPFKKGPNTLRGVRKLSIHLYHHIDPPQHPAVGRKNAASLLVTGQSSPAEGNAFRSYQSYSLSLSHQCTLTYYWIKLKLDWKSLLASSSWAVLYSGLVWHWKAPQLNKGFVWPPLCFIDICFHFGQPGRSVEWTRRASAHQ